jgi:uncharacterized protein (TIGR04255 family)
LKAFGSKIRAEYPHESSRDVLQGEFNFVASEPQARTSRLTVGYVFHSEDRSQAVQARLDGFTFSRFPKYKDWIHLVSEARRLWNIFCDSLQPTKVLRVGVRYVNQINLPLQGGKLRFEDYLATFPEMRGIREDIDLEGFFLRLVIPQQDLSAKLILTEALLPSQGDKFGVILDIDLFRENVSLDAKSEDIWPILEGFRDRKNKYFEASITDATRGLFN